jgi:predicted metal-dependent hydrolase
VDRADFEDPLGLVRGSHEPGCPVVLQRARVLLRPWPEHEQEDQVEVERRPAAAGRPPVEIRRSARRRRSASAHAQDGTVVVRVPAGLPRDEEERLVRGLVAKVTGRLRADALGGDAELERRARLLADRYLDGVHAASVRWTSRMARRWGSCTPSTGEIRISREVAAFPSWVRDYVLVHELAHLQAPGHDQRFEALVARYPRSERARGWLEGHVAGRLAAATPDAAPTEAGSGAG